jgi:hypothetical protein
LTSLPIETNSGLTPASDLRRSDDDVRSDRRPLPVRLHRDPRDEKGATCAAFLTRAAEAFARAGIARVERLITDNHMSYKRSRDMREAVAALGARHLFIKPHCP